jgi:4-hydroxybenzoate polyprenyltransferase
MTAPAAAAATPARASVALELLRSARPAQWTKNLLVLLPFFFTVQGEWDPGDPDTWWPLLWRALAGVVLFSLVSSALYMLNDVLDRERDALHPKKSRRPIASGRLSPTVAVTVAAALLAVCLPLGFVLEWRFGAVLAGYAALVAAYSLWLKRFPVVDLLVLASGFVMRAVAGALVIGVAISPWLYAVTGAGALFLGLSKRRSEVAATGVEGASHRASLRYYSLRSLDRELQLLGLALALLYAAYCLFSETTPNSGVMLVTLPFVAAGIWRYLQLTRRYPLRTPDELLGDRWLGAIGLAWLGVSITCLALFR